jgi:vancomycin resistance protein YoaR
MSDRPSEQPTQDFQPFAPLPRARHRPAPPPNPLIERSENDVILPRVRRRRRRRTFWFFAPLLAFLFLSASVAAIVLGFEFYFRDRILPNVVVLGENVGGMTRDQAESVLQEKVGNPNALLARFGGQQLVLRDGDSIFRAWPWELGFRSDLKPALDKAFALGRENDPASSLLEQARVMLFGQDITLSSAFDEGTARSYLSLLAEQVDRPPRDAELHLEGLGVVETPAVKGRRLDADETLSRILPRLLGSTSGEITISVKQVDPQTINTSVARAQIERFLAAPLILVFGDREWAIDQATLATFITIKPVANPDGSIRMTAAVDHDALVGKVKSLAREIDQAPRDARFHYDNGTLTPTITSQEGRTLDVEGTVKQIEHTFAGASAQARLAGNASLHALTPIEALRENSIPLSVQIQKPQVDMHDADKMGIKELVSQGVSNFKHSIAGRIQNIKTAAASFDGLVVPPGATFSFDQNLIDVVEANGYEDAYVIFGNRTVLGPGGGVCQVSTTAFRAAFWGGYPIVERWAHAYRVGYYEPPVGLDATVFAPDVDFKFKNDLDSFLLIETSVDEANTTLTFNFYGSKPDREVKMVGPDVTNIKPHGPAIYNDDPTLAKGTVKQVDFAVDGEDVTLYREIYVGGQLVKRERFFSRYAPWQAIYQRGTRAE